MLNVSIDKLHIRKWSLRNKHHTKGWQITSKIRNDNYNILSWILHYYRTKCHGNAQHEISKYSKMLNVWTLRGLDTSGCKFGGYFEAKLAGRGSYRQVLVVWVGIPTHAFFHSVTSRIQLIGSRHVTCTKQFSTTNIKLLTY